MFDKIFDMGLGVAHGYAKVAQKIWAVLVIGKVEIVTNMYTKIIRIGLFRPKFEL